MIFKTLRPKNGLIEIKARRSTATQRNQERWIVLEKPFVAARQGTRDIMEFHQLLGHPTEDIKSGTAQKARMRLMGE